MESDAFAFGREPFSVTIAYFHVHFRRACFGTRPLLVIGSLLLIGGFSGVSFFSWTRLFVFSLSVFLVCLGLLCVVVWIGRIAGPWRALNYTSFLALHQHDRALAGLSDALTRGRSILLFLRDFGDEEVNQLYFDFENLLISLIGDSQVLVAIANPSADPTLKISPIPRLIAPNARWREVVSCLIERATRIVVAAEKVRAGLSYEIDLIRQKNAADKTMLVDMTMDAEETPRLSQLSDFRWRVSVRDFRQDDVFGWLGEHALMTFASDDKTAPPKMCYQSRGLRFAWARISLLGFRSLVPRTKFTFYRDWLGAFDEFDPLESVRDEVLAEEKRATERGQVVWPMDLMFTVPEGSSNPFFEAWNEQKKLQRRMETSVFVMSRRSSWTPIRRALHRASVTSFGRVVRDLLRLLQ